MVPNKFLCVTLSKLCDLLSCMHLKSKLKKTFEIPKICNLVQDFFELPIPNHMSTDSSVASSFLLNNAFNLTSDKIIHLFL